MVVFRHSVKVRETVWSDLIEKNIHFFFLIIVKVFFLPKPNYTHDSGVVLGCLVCQSGGLYAHNPAQPSPSPCCHGASACLKTMICCVHYSVVHRGVEATF